MEPAQFCSTSRVFVVAGKGGVGKTTVTATLAVLAHRAGASVLVVEIEGKSGLDAALGVPPLTQRPRQARPGLMVRRLAPEAALLEHLDARGLGRVARRLARSGVLDVVAAAVPGMREIIVLGAIKQIERSGVADVVIVDTPAAGHAIRFLTSPRGLRDAMRVGPVRAQAEEVVEMLTDPARCQAILVTLPEETPVNELVESAYALEDEVGIALGPVVVNAMPSPLDTKGRSAAADAEALGVSLSEPRLAALDAAAAFQQERHRLAAVHADRLADRLPLAQLRLPFITNEIGPDEIDRLADALATELERLTP